MSDLRRRQFIKNTLGAGMASSILVPGILQGSQGQAPQIDYDKKYQHASGKPKKVIVAGAGIAGLCCGYELMKSGHEVVVLEAAKRHGGHVMTIHDGLSDGLYADGGAEQITKPGYELYWGYTKEFNLTVLPYLRRRNQLYRVDKAFYTDDMLKDPVVLKKLGFNEREVKYLAEHAWGDLSRLFVDPYLGKFKDEYQPFGVGYDHLDTVPISDIYKKEGASPTALRFLGGNDTSALFELWRCAILHLRGVDLTPQNVFRLKGGNQGLPDAFAKRLGPRVKLNSPILSIHNGDNNVTVKYREFGVEKEMTADYLANCIPLPVFRKIPVTPALSPEKQFVVDNVRYGSYAHFIFQASSRFWLEDGLKSINMQLDHPDIHSIWQIAEEVESHRVILLADGPGGVSAERALAGFRELYPGKSDTIEQALVKDWTKDPFAPTCEREKFPMGQLSKFWPNIMKSHGRIYFAGSYADNLNWGQEAATRSANRVAREIDLA